MSKISEIATLKDVVEAIEEELGIGMRELRAQRRNKDFVFGRHLYVRLAMDYTAKSTVQIGNFIDRDHTSILHLYKKKMEDDLELAYRRTGERLKAKLTSSLPSLS